MKISRIIGFFLCLVFLVSMSLLPVYAEISENSENETRPAYSKGDLNGDGQITSVDYLMLKRIFLGTLTPTVQQLFAADVNKDGKIASVDYLMVRRYFYQTYYFSPDVLQTQIPLTEEQIEAIKADYVEYLKEEVGEEHFTSLTVSDIIVGKYYGPYSGNYAIFIKHSEILYHGTVTTKFLAGYKFVFANSQTLIIYNNSSFIDLETAYETGLISEDDIYNLSWYFK